jgi:colanic acid biosynthesis glycosyl transferase WcaI
MDLPHLLIVGMHYDPEPSGNAPYTTALARGLVRRGHQVDVLTGVPHYPAWSITQGYGAWKDSASEHGVSVTRLRHYVAGNPTTTRRVAMELSFGVRAAVAVRRGAAVVICVSPALLASALTIARLKSSLHRPAVGLWVQDLYSQGLAEMRQGSSRLGGFAPQFEGRVAGCFDGVGVVHDRFKHQVVTSLGIPPERVDVLRNWTHLTEGPRTDVVAVRRRLGWRKGETVALHAGNMGVKQALENVVAAAAEAHRRQASVRFVFLGGGNQMSLLRTEAAGLPNVDFLSSLPADQFAETLAAADVLLVNERPDVKEMSVPSKLTSYYTSGRPVVAAVAPDGITASEIELSGAGVQVPPGDPSALLLAIELLAGDLRFANQCGANGRRFYREHLTESAALDRFEAWINKLVVARYRS